MEGVEAAGPAEEQLACLGDADGRSPRSTCRCDLRPPRRQRGGTFRRQQRSDECELARKIAPRRSGCCREAVRWIRDTRRPHERGRLLSGSRTACSPGRSPLDDFIGRMRFVVDVIYRVTTRVTAISISSLTRRADFASRNAFAEQTKTIARTARSSSRTHDLEPKNPVLR